MMVKKETKGKCPFRGLKECSIECVLYRTGYRVNEQTNQTFPVESCGFNIIIDNLEAMHNRSFMLQKEVGETKNMMALKILSEMGMQNDQEVVDNAMRIINIPDNNKKLLGQ
jgi:hypothetical protein